jgi:hypothetical protein
MRYVLYWLVLATVGCAAQPAPRPATPAPAPVAVPPPAYAPGPAPEPLPAAQTPAPAPAPPVANQGNSCETAIPIQAANEQEGVGAEYVWLKQHYPGYRLREQALMQCSGRPADRMSIVTADGQSLDVFFDISSFFGKL